jgi:hypothetical protein
VRNDELLVAVQVDGLQPDGDTDTVAVADAPAPARGPSEVGETEKVQGAA